jgi:hypothetical protein
MPVARSGDETGVRMPASNSYGIPVAQTNSNLEIRAEIGDF